MDVCDTRLGSMDPPVTLGPGPPAIKIKKEVKEEPEYIYVDETVCRVKLEESDEEVILPKDDMVLGSEAALLVLEGQPVQPPAQSQPARRGRKPRILRASRGNTHTCTTTARKILPRPSPMQVPLTLSHLQPPPPPLSLPPPARSKPSQTPVMVRPALQPPTPTNSGRKILPWPHQLTPASLAPASQQQKLQPLNPSLTTCPSSAQALPLTHLQPISPGGNSGLMPLQPLSLTQLRSPPPSSCISQLGVPLSPQKMPVPPKGSRKTVAALPQLGSVPPTPCTRVPLLPLPETTVKKSSPSPSVQTTTASHVRKLLPRPLKAAVRQATNAVFQQQQQQGTLTALQQLHPVPPVSTQQTVSLQQFQSLSPSTTQTTSLALQTLNVSGQPAPLSGPSQMVSLQRVRALAVPPSQSSQKAKPPEPSLQPPHYLHNVASSTSPQRLTFQQVQQAPAISVSQGVTIHSLPALASSSQQQQATALCQVHTLQSSAGHTQGSRGTPLQTTPNLASDSQKAVPVHHYSSHAPGDMQAVSQVSPVGSKSTLPQMCSATFCTPQSTAPSQAEPQNSDQQTLTFHDLSSSSHTLREVSTLCSDTSHPAKAQDVVSLHVAPRQGIATVGSGIPVGATPNGTVLKVPIQPLRSSPSFPKVKRKYLRRSPRDLRASRKKDMPILKLGSVTTYSWPLSVQEKDLFTSTSAAAMQGRKILPRPCPTSLVDSQREHVQPVTTHSSPGWLVPQVGQDEGCGSVGTSLNSPSVGTLTHTATSSESQLSTRSLGHSSTNSLVTTDQVDTGEDDTEESFLQPVSPAKAVTACSSIPSGKEITAAPEGSSSDTVQEVGSSGGSQVVGDKGTKTDDSMDQPDLDCTESSSISKVDIDCPPGPLHTLNDEAGWNQVEKSLVTPKNDQNTSGDSTLDHSTSQVTAVHNIHTQPVSQDTSEGDPQDQFTTGDNAQSQSTKQDFPEKSIQDQTTSHDVIRDSLQDHHTTINDTLGDSTQNQCTLQDTSEDSIQDQPTSQNIPGNSSHGQPTLHDTPDEGTYCQPTLQNDPVDSILDHPSSQNTQEGITVDESITQQSSVPSAVVLPLIISSSQGEKNLREENNGQISQDPVYKNTLSTSNFAPQLDSSLQDQNVCSPSLSPSSPSQSRFSEASSPTPPEATAVYMASHIAQEQNTVYPINKSLPSSYLCHNNSWESPSSLPLWPLPDMKERSLSTSNLPTSTSLCSIPSVPSTVGLGLPTSPKSSLKPPVSPTVPEEVKEEVPHTTEHMSSLCNSGASHLSCLSLSEIMKTKKDEPIFPVVMLPQDSADCSIPERQDSSSTNSSTSYPPGHLREDFRVITATTTAVAATTTTVTITTTTTEISTTTTTTQHITAHTCMEAKEQESSNPLSQEKMDSSASVVPPVCHLSEPKCPQTCILVEKEMCHEDCPPPPKGRRKTWRKYHQQHSIMQGSRLRAIVRAQRRTIQVLRHKLYREQRRSKALWEALRRGMASKANIEGEMCPKGSRVAKREEGEGVTQPHPSPPVTRSRNKPKEVAAATLPSANLKRKCEDKPNEVLKKIVTLDHQDDHELEEDNPHVPAIRVPTPTAGKTEIQTLVREFMMRDDISRPTGHGTRHCLHYLPLLHKRFMADCCQPCSLKTFQQHLPPQVAQRVGEELETCVCLTCQNPELKVESLVRRRLLPLNTHLEEVAFSPETTFKEFLTNIQALKGKPFSQLSYSEWFLGVGGGSSAPLPQKRTLTRPLREVATQLEGELDLLRLHLTRAAQQYDATFRAKCEAEQSPQHAVLQAEWSPLIILHALGADGTPALQQVVSLQCGYLWSRTDSLGFIAVSNCRDQRAAAVCASLEPLLTRLIQQGVCCLTLLVDPKTDLSAVLEYARQNDLEVRWVFSEPGHGAGVAEAVGNSVTQLICDTVNSWGPETVLSAKDVFSLISPNSSNLVYYYSEEDVWRSGQLLRGPSGPTKTANKLIKPKTLLSL